MAFIQPLPKSTYYKVSHPQTWSRSVLVEVRDDDTILFTVFHPSLFEGLKINIHEIIDEELVILFKGYLDLTTPAEFLRQRWLDLFSSLRKQPK